MACASSVYGSGFLPSAPITDIAGHSFRFKSALESYPWWRVNLNGRYTIDAVVISIGKDSLASFADIKIYLLSHDSSNWRNRPLCYASGPVPPTISREQGVGNSTSGIVKLTLPCASKVVASHVMIVKEKWSFLELDRFEFVGSGSSKSKFTPGDRHEVCLTSSA